MPSYEAAVILKSALSRPRLKSSVMHLCQTIINEGGLIKSVENLGRRELPNVVKANEAHHTHGSYFCIQFESSVEAMEKIDKTYRVTKEVIRTGVLKKQEQTRRPCLDGPCLFGELPNPDHDRAAYTRKLMTKYKNKKVSV